MTETDEVQGTPSVWLPSSLQSNSNRPSDVAKDVQQAAEFEEVKRDVGLNNIKSIVREAVGLGDAVAKTGQAVAVD